MITGFIGVMGSGKGFQQALLVKKGAVALDFKDALIEMCEDIVGFPIEADYELFKECVVGLTAPICFAKPDAWVGNERLHIKARTKDMLSQYPNLMTGRLLLQRVGTEAMRKRNPNYWCEAWEKKAREILADGKDIAVSDVRFSNEMQTIRKVGLGSVGKNVSDTYRFMFCDYKSERYNATQVHASEWMAQEYLKQGLKDGQEIPF